MAKTFGKRPSSIVRIRDRWLAYQFDAAVSFLGTVIENASQEMAEVGGVDGGKQFVPKYPMEQLLDPDFRLPRPKTAVEKERDAINILKALAGKKGSGVRIFKANSANNAQNKAE